MFKHIYKGLAIFVVAILLTALLATPVLAFEGRSGDSVIVASGEVIDDDLYVSGNAVTINGTVNGDVWAMGNDVTINGEINGNLVAAGNNLEVNGDISHSARIAGNALYIRGNVGADVLAFGSNLTVSSAASIGNDLVVGAAQADINAPIGGDIIGGGGVVILSSTVGGNVHITVDDFTLLPTADIVGNLVYVSENAADIQAGAKVEGSITHNLPEVIEKIEAAEAGANIPLKILGFLMMLLVGIVLALVAPKRMTALTEAIRSRPWHCLGWGALFLCATPVAILIALITVVGIPISLIALVIYLIAIYLTQLFIGLLLGRLIIGLFKGVTENKGVLIGSLALGFAILTLIKLIPYLGFVIGLATVLFGLGAILVSERQLRGFKS